MALTKKQIQIFEALLFLIQKGERPTVREVGALVGLSSSATVMKHLEALEQEGWISRSGKSRGIRVLRVLPPLPPRGGVGETSYERGGIPVRGKIAAGRPIAAIDEHEVGADESAPPVLSVDPRMFSASAFSASTVSDGGELMALQVAGDSMIEAGILDGDHVIIRCQPKVEEGEIAAVDIDGEVTLKRWRGGTGGDNPPSVRLLPANARFAPIEITAEDHKEVRVLGKYVGLVRGSLHFF